MADAQQTLMNALLRQRGTMGAPNSLFMGPSNPNQFGGSGPPTTLPGQMPMPPGQMGGMAGPPVGYQEWQPQGPPPSIAGGEPYQATPQINDIQQLFNNSIMRNAPTSNPMGGQFLRDITLGGHLAGGNDI